MNSQILNRILNAEESKYIVAGSTPVISFGDFTVAKILTVSINPSSLEFARKGRLLPRDEKRLVDKELLEIAADAPLRAEHAEKIWDGCRNYFKTNPYSWFESLETLLSAINRSYYDGNSAHVDLVQWATFPAWKEIPVETQRNLIARDSEFLKYQISMPNVEQIVINGRAVANAIQGIQDFTLEVKGELKYMSGEKIRTCQLLAGKGPEGKKLVGWTSTIKSLQVSNEERSRIYHELGLWIERNI